MQGLWPWRRFSLALPLAPFPAPLLTAVLIATLLDIPCRWLVERLAAWLAAYLAAMGTPG